MVRGVPTFAVFAPRLRRCSGRTPCSWRTTPASTSVLNGEFARCGVEPLPLDTPILDPLLIERRVTSRSLGPTYKRYTGKALQTRTPPTPTCTRWRGCFANNAPCTPTSAPDVEDLVDWRRRPPGPVARATLRDEAASCALDSASTPAAAAEVPEYLA